VSRSRATGEIEVLAAGLDLEDATLAGLLALAELDDPTAERLPLRRRRVAEAILRMVLGRRLGCPPSQVAIARSPQGKPHLSQRCSQAAYGPPGQPQRDRQPPLRFSLAHSGACALIALSADRDVGVDLESIDLRRPHERLARRWFTTAEHALVASRPTLADRACAFYRLWTAKEACVKATGEGPAALRQVEICGDEALWLRPRLGSVRWRVQELDLGPGWAAAVAAPGLDWRATLECWRPFPQPQP